jgi:hypothetical protein
LVDRGDEPGLTRAIVTLARNPSLRIDLGRRAQAAVAERFASDRLLMHIDDLYRERLTARTTRHGYFDGGLLPPRPPRPITDPTEIARNERPSA